MVLRAFIDNNPGIKRSYSAWLSPSDLLARLIDQFEKPNLKRLLPLALARDLREERDVRLRDAGQETERPIYLDEVFVDLPVNTQIHRAPPIMGVKPIYQNTLKAAERADSATGQCAVSRLCVALPIS